MTCTLRWFPRLILAAFWITSGYAGFQPAGFQPVSQPASQTFVVTKTADTNDGACDSDCSLREAIRAANNSPGPDTITFSQPGTQTYLLTRAGTGEDNNQTGDLDILGELTLQGNGQGVTILDGNHVDRVFSVAPSITVTITGMTIQNGDPPSGEILGGGGILSKGEMILDDVELANNRAIWGGGITNSQGKLVISRSTIQNNGDEDTQGGGGIHSDGDLELEYSAIISNTAILGGGVSGTLSSNMIFHDVSFIDNQAVQIGGAIYNDKLINLENCILSGNLAGSGGGIYNNYLLYAVSTTFDHNIASGYGGAVYNDGLLSLTNATLSANEATNQGGAIFNTETLSMKHVTFALNQAALGASLYNGQNAQVTTVNSIFSRDQANPNCTNLGEITSLGHNLEDVNSCSLTGSGDLVNKNPFLAPLALNSFKTATHDLLDGSPAIEAGDPAQCAAADQRGVLRPVDGDKNGTPLCDIGAVEHANAGWISFSPTAYTSNEGTAVTVSVVRFSSTEHVCVDYVATTLPLWDFTPVSGSFCWAVGDIGPKTFQVTILDDNYREPDKQIILQLKNARYGAGIYPSGTAIITVPANDPDGEDPPAPIYLPITIRQ